MGQTSGSYGLSPGDLPSNISSRPAGEAGVPPGSFPANQPVIAGSGVAAETPAADGAVALGQRWNDLRRALLGAFPDLQASFVAVPVTEVEARLRALRPGTANYPDAMVGEAATAAYAEKRLVHLSALAPLGISAYDSPSYEAGRPGEIRDCIVMRGAADPEAARAFAVWLRDGQQAGAERFGMGVGGSAEGVALNAAQIYLRGGGLGEDADRARAEFSAATARQQALGPFFDSRMSPESLRLQIDVLAGVANTQFAVVGLRAIVSSMGAFGVLHPVMVLRRGDDGKWKVLQISGNVSMGLMADSVGAFKPVVTAPPKLTQVAGIKQAAPVDNDTRSGVPDLWWDNVGDAPLEVVEWQAHLPGGWSDTKLALLPDVASRLQTRVRADFLQQPMLYRWRVWSLGNGGVMALSPWRRLTVLPQ